jgi:hypothetical protein
LLVSSELASRFTRVDPVSKLNVVGVNTITALDPPSELNLIQDGGYDLNYKLAGIQRPKEFRNVSRFSRAFLGSRSIAGNDVFASWAHESFLMDFGPLSNPRNEHRQVVDTLIPFNH